MIYKTVTSCITGAEYCIDFYLLVFDDYEEKWLMTQNSVTVYTSCDEYLWNILLMWGRM